jgi:ELWxxDGT repeat protein
MGSDGSIGTQIREGQMSLFALRSGSGPRLRARGPLRRAGACAPALGALLASLLAVSAGAAPGDLNVNRVANINPGAGDSIPSELTNVNGTLFFQADDGTNGPELWKSDGTTATMVLNINPTAGVGSSPTELTNVNGTLFFRADDGTNGFELWKSDGTSATMVSNINPTAGQGSGPVWLTNVNGTLFLVASDGTDGFELWKSDGTMATMVADINPTAGTGSEPEDLTDVNGTLFFAANDGTNGTELWKSNGGPLGAGGTEMVADINPTAGTGSSPSQFAEVNGTLFFQADDGTNGLELWKSDGGALGSGTEMVDNIAPLGGDSDPESFTNVNGTAFFVADDGTNGIELFKSQSPYTSAAIVADINPTAAQGSNPVSLTNVNGTLFFGAYEDTNGKELWKSNGGPLGAGGTEMVADINPTAGTGSLPDPPQLANLNGTLFFSADDGAAGIELWKSDGGALGSGTEVVANINPTAGAGSYPQGLIDVNGTLFFSANDGSTGLELWRGVNEGPVGPAQRCAGKEATIAGASPTIAGTNGNDVIRGTPARDVIAGLGGKDVIRGRGGGDLICGGPGNDTLIGGAGADKLLGQAGRDTLKGGVGRDTLKGGKGRDRLIGGPGRDTQRQ